MIENPPTLALSQPPTNALIQRIQRALDNPITDDCTVDPIRELTEVLATVGLDLTSSGGAIRFVGRDPIVRSALPLATMAAIALMAKAISVADLWRFRGGAAQDLSVNLGQVLHRLCPFYDRKWELLNGYPPGNPADPTNPFMPNNMFRTRDGRRILLMNIYPSLKTKALAFLGCHDSPAAIGEVVRKWDAFELEEAMNRAGLQATVVRSPAEFLAEEQAQYVSSLPLIEIEKVGDSDPEPFTTNPVAPLSGIRALGLSHVIAGAGCGRALAYHGADVLNVWRPEDYELDFNYYTANVGMRSTILDVTRGDEMARLKALVADADVFFANRRPGYIESIGLSTDDLALIRPGIVHVDISIYGARGPWANRIGFDQTAGGVSGVLALEGSVENPKLPEIFVVNDYITAWLASVGAMAALKRRAVEGGSYRVRISLARLSLWLLQMGVFDKAYAYNVAGTDGEHSYLAPELFQVETPCGHYQGVTDQVTMSGTPGHYQTPLVPRGASKAEWLPR
ncbi:carnitine dehydratase [Paraburkholderia panacisoli]|uniref:Carnitine dehydratase n=1 Tax=Paraburkholderia panacisoli TaxID=2603818 RepID=A0A5B0GPM9_9BURK|nr:CoA transferase [Paraburkholderia panacisoli]KAA1004050.1 carnitine dehydratase [Paraburkholderia panacisoli]